MDFPKRVRIVEVGPRDGLQNETKQVSIEDKVKLIEMLVQTGIRHIESGSFVNPDWIPQMANSDAVFREIKRLDGVCYSALVPNIQGYTRALEVNASEVAVFSAASNTFTQKNTNCSIDESLSRAQLIIEQAKNSNIPVRGYVSCVIACPYEGNINPKDVAHVAKALIDMGCHEVSLGDTIGAGTPKQTQTLINTITQDLSVNKLAVHFHDTYGQALANIYAALELGIEVIDCSVAGLGGCPYAKGASGNVATEDVVYMLNGLGIEHGINLDALITTGNSICRILKRDNGSKVSKAMS